MAESPVLITDEEREYLVNLLMNTQKDTRVEEHRTRAPSFRAHLIHNEELIASLLAKLGPPAK